MNFSMLRDVIQFFVDKGLLDSALSYSFVANALISVVVIAPLLGFLGTMVISKRLAFFSNAVGSATITGVAIGILLGEPITAPYISMFSFAILFATYLYFTSQHSRVSHENVIGIFLATFFALGASLLYFVTRKINPHLLDSVMFGSIVTVNDSDITVLVISAVIVLVLGWIFFNDVVLGGFNSVLASVRGVKVTLVNYGFVIMIALITVVSVKIIGAVLVEALLLIPAAASRNITRSIRGFILMSIIISLLSGVSGVLLPVVYNITIPSGSAIIIVAFLLFLVTLIFRKKGLMELFLKVCKTLLKNIRKQKSQTI